MTRLLSTTRTVLIFPLPMARAFLSPCVYYPPVPLSVTAVRVFPFDLSSVGQQTVAFAEIGIEGAIVIRGIRVHRTPAGGLFISFPKVRSPKSGFSAIVEPVNPAAAKAVRDAVVLAYKELCAGNVTG